MPTCRAGCTAELAKYGQAKQAPTPCLISGGRPQMTSEHLKSLLYREPAHLSSTQNLEQGSRVVEKD